MAGFIYAIPNVNNVNDKTLEESGLARLFGDAVIAQRDCMKGPAGGGCVLLSIGEDSEKLYYKPDIQTWSKSLNGKYHIGFYIDEPPQPEELKRPEQIAGHIVKLGENEWRVPLARMFLEGTQLPQSLLMGPDGKLITKILPEYAEFSSKTEKLWKYISYQIGLSDEPLEISSEELWHTAVGALGLNYYVGADEVNAMQLLTTANMQKIFEAVVDIPSIIKISKELAKSQKKTDEQAAGDG